MGNETIYRDGLKDILCGKSSERLAGANEIAPTGVLIRYANRVCKNCEWGELAAIRKCIKYR